jgi:hypothetical protein
MKTFLITLILAPIVLPALAASDPHPARGLRRSVWWVLAFNAAYAVIVKLLFPLSLEEAP